MKRVLKSALPIVAAIIGLFVTMYGWGIWACVRIYGSSTRDEVFSLLFIATGTLLFLSPILWTTKYKRLGIAITTVTFIAVLVEVLVLFTF